MKEKNSRLFASTPTEGSADLTSLKPQESEVVDDGKISLDPALWQAGFLRVIDGVQVVGAYNGDDEEVSVAVAAETPAAEPTEFWVCEVNEDELMPGDFVVVTPVAGIEGNGTDVIRVKKAEL